jgi:hypothetical protein
LIQTDGTVMDIPAMDKALVAESPLRQYGGRQLRSDLTGQLSVMQEISGA